MSTGLFLRAAAEHLHDAADLFIATDHGIDLPCFRAGGEIGAVFLQRLVFALGVLIRPPAGYRARRSAVLNSASTTCSTLRNSSFSAFCSSSALVIRSRRSLAM
jgi:hypothetical protein